MISGEFASMVKAAPPSGELLKEPAEILTDKDIDAMMAEAIAVDALFQKIITLRYGLSSVVTSYLAPVMPAVKVRRTVIRIGRVGLSPAVPASQP